MMLSSLPFTFVVKRQNNVIRHVDDWRSAVLLTTVHELYIAVMWVFSTVQYKIRCLWKPKHIWYDWRSFLIFVKTMKKIWGNHQGISKIKTIYFQNNTCVGCRNTNRFWTFYLQRFCRIPASIMTLSTISPTWIKLRAMNWMRRVFERFGVVRWCWSYDISIVLYIAVVWVFLTFVSKLLVLNHTRNDVEQLIYAFVLKRLINVIRYVDDWKVAVLLTTDHNMLYIAVMWVFSTVQYKFAVYENRSISDMTKKFYHIQNMRRLWGKYERIIKEYRRFWLFISKHMRES